MNLSVKQRWLTALRSGEYTQGTRKMRGTDSTYCCLGALCELYKSDHPDAMWKPALLQSDRYRFDDGSWDPNEHAYIPPNVQEWSELSASPWFSRGEKKIHLAELNDDTCDGKYTKVIQAIEREL